MSACPAGHESAAADYCEVCGIRMNDPAPLASGSPAAADPGGEAPSSQSPGVLCPRCGSPGLGRFCEECGYSASGRGDDQNPSPVALPVTAPGSTADPGGTPDAPAVPRWTAVVSASRVYFDSVQAVGGPGAASVIFPGKIAERRFALDGAQMRIGRRSVSREVIPEIDLSGPPADPGISRLQAILLAQPDGTWAIVDPGSENGTIVNGCEILPGQQVQLSQSDSICIGAWTQITIVAEAAAEAG